MSKERGKKEGRPAPEEGTAERGGGAQYGPSSSANVATLAPKVKVEPLRDQLLVLPFPAKGLQSAFLTVVSDHQLPAVRGEVLAVGPEVRDIKVGQHVVFSKLQGFEVMGYLVLAEHAVLATEPR